MRDVPRITVEELLDAKSRDPDLLLVCAYDDEEKCRGLKIDDALTLDQLEARLASVPLPKQVPLVFYCA